MKRKIFLVFAVLLLVLPFYLAQTELVEKPITRLHLVGNGIAVNSENAMDFMHAKAAIGAVRIASPNKDANAAVKRLGVLVLDNTTYHLKDIAVSLDEVSADVHEKDGNGAVGQLYVARYEKLGQDIWAGELSMGEAVYNVYFLGLKRQFKPVEAAAKIGDYCEDNPEAEKCIKVVDKCADNPRACKAKIMAHCEENPMDKECLSLQKRYCLKNASDVRCTAFLREDCKENPAQVFCKIRKVKNKDIISIDSAEVESGTAEGGEDDGEFSKPIVAVKNRWRVRTVRSSGGDDDANSDDDGDGDGNRGSD